MALTNGPAGNALRLLERGGITPLLEDCLSVEDVRRWKPAPAPYLYAAERCGVAAEQVMLVAVHRGTSTAPTAPAWCPHGSTAMTFPTRSRWSRLT